MRSKKAIEETIRTNFNFTVDAPLRDQLLARAAEEQRRSQPTNAALSEPSIGRILMKNSMIKLAVAAAVIAVVGLGVREFLGTGSTAGVVWADVARKVQASRGVVFRTVRHDTPAFPDGGCDYTMDHYSSARSRVDKYKAGEVIGTIYSDCNTKTMVLVGHDHKAYVKMTAADTMPDGFQMGPNSMVQRFLSCEHRELEPKTIDGVLCEGIETTDPIFYGGDSPPERLLARVWVSVETGYPVRIEGDYVNENGRRRLEFVQDQFQWDVELDESLFEPNIPAGYIDISP